MRNHTIRPQLDQVLPPPYLNQLQKVTFQKNDYICTQGQAITELTYILSGKVKIVRSLFNGKEHILETLNQPQILGDVELMTNQPAGSSVIALEEVQAVQLPLNNKEELLKDPVFLYQIGRNLARALHKQGITASTNASYSVKERLATHMLSIEEEGVFSTITIYPSCQFLGLAIAMCNESSNNLSIKELLKKKLLRPIVFCNDKPWKNWLLSIRKSLTLTLDGLIFNPFVL